MYHASCQCYGKILMSEASCRKLACNASSSSRVAAFALPIVVYTEGHLDLLHLVSDAPFGYLYGMSSFPAVLC